MNDLADREAVLACARAMSREGLSPGQSGNVSLRTAGGCLITPTGMPYESTTPEDLAHVDLAGDRIEGGRAPSSEWHFHVAIYRAFPEAHAIVHAHSSSATSLACLRKPIPAFHYMVAVAGGRDIRVADYATFGTQSLAINVVHALEGRRACLLANHGQVAFGDSLARALDLAREVEALSAQYLGALAVGSPISLSDAEMDLVLEKFRSYGQPPKK